MPNYLEPMTLSDLLDRAVRLTGKIFRRSITIAAIVMLPAGLIAGFAMRELFAALADMMNYLARDPHSMEAMVPFIYGTSEMAVAMLLLAFASCIMQASAIDLTDAEINFAERSWQGAFARAWHHAFRLFAQYLIKFLGMYGAFIITLILCVHTPFMVTLFIPLTVFVVWLWVRWSLGAQAIVCEGHGPVSGLYRSNRLIMGSWWRVTGLLLIFGLLVQFAVSLVTLPLFGFSFFPMLMKFSNLNANSADYMRAADELLLAFSSIGWAIGLVMAISSTLRLILFAAYKTLLQYDLRARQGEFEASVPEEPVPAQ
jgi:hypothetical protein